MADPTTLEAVTRLNTALGLEGKEKFETNKSNGLPQIKISKEVYQEIIKGEAPQKMGNVTFYSASQETGTQGWYVAEVDSTAGQDAKKGGALGGLAAKALKKDHILYLAPTGPGVVSEGAVKDVEGDHKKAMQLTLDGDIAGAKAEVKRLDAAKAAAGPVLSNHDLAAQLNTNQLKFNDNLEATLDKDHANHLRDVLKGGVDPVKLFGSDKVNLEFKTDALGDITGATIRIKGKLDEKELKTFADHKTAIDLTIDKGASMTDTVKGLIAFASGEGKPKGDEFAVQHGLRGQDKAAANVRGA